MPFLDWGNTHSNQIFFHHLPHKLPHLILFFSFIKWLREIVFSGLFFSYCWKIILSLCIWFLWGFALTIYGYSLDFYQEETRLVHFFKLLMIHVNLPRAFIYTWKTKINVITVPGTVKSRQHSDKIEKGEETFALGHHVRNNLALKWL